MRDFTVAGAILHETTQPVAGASSILLVCNQRHDGRMDWTPPGGVVDAGETVLEALAREVKEETALVVSAWGRLLYQVEVDFVGRDFSLSASIYEATAWSGSLHVDDPDGIVVDAHFAGGDSWAEKLALAPRWVAEPLQAWHDERWTDARTFAFRAERTDSGLRVHRLDA